MDSQQDGERGSARAVEEMRGGGGGNSLLMWHTSLCNMRNENETVPDQRCCMLARDLLKQAIMPFLMDNRWGLAFELVLGLQPI
ncbi:hypothetical protein CKAN_01611700 [Cinnamomum micranthum f. kanehirae]|uniref:Uncharacterized protein n=1 Tax=Cinnamomum micranthum f. kanehirae TaxID=337451 RepID=A0A3S3NGJ5_9MAGN|nr:hypothetical protein CKAN_01611700 [Cinnamomum micranthum f. kanehirae]